MNTLAKVRGFKATLDAVASIAILFAIFLLWPGPASADSYDDAERASNEFLDQYEKLRSLNVSEIRRFVQAMCDAEDSARKEVYRDARARVENEVEKFYSTLSASHDRAVGLLGSVQKDPAFASKQSSIHDYEAKVAERWERIERMKSNGVLGGNNPVFSQMREIGQVAHHAYQEHSGNCDRFPWRLRSGEEVDCLKRSPCEIIEIKPNNSSSLSSGRSQVRRYLAQLNGQEDFDKLVEEDKSFGQCHLALVKPAGLRSPRRLLQ